MDKHGIDMSIVRYASFSYHSYHSRLRYQTSSANPWLDFLSTTEAQSLASELNADLEDYCSSSPSLSQSLRRLYGFGLLPLVSDISTSAILETIQEITKYRHLKGIIMGTRGIGQGLDDERLDPVWKALADAGLVVFLHPHYGVDQSAWGEKNNGHVLPLALGFPFETTIVSAEYIIQQSLTSPLR